MRRARSASEITPLREYNSRLRHKTISSNLASRSTQSFARLVFGLLSLIVACRQRNNVLGIDRATPHVPDDVIFREAGASSFCKDRGCPASDVFSFVCACQGCGRTRRSDTRLSDQIYATRQGTFCRRTRANSTFRSAFKRRTIWAISGSFRRTALKENYFRHWDNAITGPLARTCVWAPRL